MAVPRSVCPQCHRTYSAAVRVCKADGSLLIEEVREVRPGSPEGDGPLGAGAVIIGETGRGPPPPPPPPPDTGGGAAAGVVGAARNDPPSQPHAPSPAPPPPPATTAAESAAPPSPGPPRRPTRPVPVAPRPASVPPAPHSATLPPRQDDSLAGLGGQHGFERLGPYRLLRQLGEGGMARIYLAEHEKLGRICAIKRLHADHFGDRLTVARFLAEARAVGAIHHPNLVSAYDVVEEPTEIYLVMEYLDGRDVAQVLRDEGPMPVERVAEIMAQACDGLAAVHAHNIIHRDLKPENIFLTRLPDGGERVKLLDFGVARLLGDRPQELRTRSGLTVGTPTYMSPEQATASEIDARSDIYTVGVVLYEMLTGAPPFTGAGYGDVMLMHVNDPPPRPSTRRPDLPAWIEDIVMRCLEKVPSARFGSAADLAAALRHGTAVRRNTQTGLAPRETRRMAPLAIAEPKTPRWAWAAGAVGTVVLVAAAAALLQLRRPGAAATGTSPASAAARSTGIFVRVTSTPTGATVLVAGLERCRTPCDVALPDGGREVLVEARADGFLFEQKLIDPASPPANLSFALRPRVLLPRAPAAATPEDAAESRRSHRVSRPGTKAGKPAVPSETMPRRVETGNRDSTLDPFK